MCGIAGFVDFSGHERGSAEQRLRAMNQALLHRGPDEGGVYLDANAALGHRRLAIIDLSGGQQPMSAAEGRLQIVFNGEIYNFAETRAQLRAAGLAFRTNSDTEVILNAYLHWGEQCVEHLHGMFAFAIWDSRERTLFLARDRLGKKPLYYYRNGPLFAFASELKALRAGHLIPDELDPESLDCYFTFGYIPSPRTIYKNVRKLPAARTLLVSAAGERSPKPYWNLSFANPVPRTLDEAVEEFEPLLDEAVRCRLVGEVPLGAFLSGGVDSSLVVSSMARLSGQPVITNSIGFDDAKYNELEAAKLIAGHLRTNHHEFVVKPRAADVLPRIAWHFDEPIADSSAVPTWYVCEMARRTVTVALSGDGGDEAFGGYTFRYRPHMLEARIRAALPAALRAPFFGALGAAWPASARLPQPLRLKTIFENLAVGDAEAFYRDLIWLRGDARQKIYGGDFLGSLNGFTPMETVYPLYSGSDAPDALGRSQYTDINFYMTDDVLAKVDRMSMAHSLEVRAPLMDHRVFEFAARLPAHLKIDGKRGKVVLRELAARRLPDEITRLPKRGFSIPAAQWLRTELKPMAESLILDRNGIVANLLDRGQIERTWREHQSGSRDHNVFLWGLMMLGLWEQGVRAPMTAASP
jgi:asparagine synthase (glutamine-hydrolysing)